MFRLGSAAARVLAGDLPFATPLVFDDETTGTPSSRAAATAGREGVVKLPAPVPVQATHEHQARGAKLTDGLACDDETLGTGCHGGRDEDPVLVLVTRKRFVDSPA